MDWEFALSPLDVISVVVIAATGLLTGLVVVWQMPSVRNGQAWLLTGFAIAILGIIFFTARGVGYLYAGNHLAARNFGFALLWLIYTAAITVGVAVRRRR